MIKLPSAESVLIQVRAWIKPYDPKLTRAEIENLFPVNWHTRPYTKWHRDQLPKVAIAPRVCLCLVDGFNVNTERLFDVGTYTLGSQSTADWVFKTHRSLDDYKQLDGYLSVSLRVEGNSMTISSAQSLKVNGVTLKSAELNDRDTVHIGDAEFIVLFLTKTEGAPN